MLDVVQVGRSKLCWRKHVRLLSSRRRIKRGDTLVTSKLFLGGFSASAGKVLRLILVGTLEGVQSCVHLLIYSCVFPVLAFIKECDSGAALDVRCGSRRQLVTQGHCPCLNFLFLYFLVLTRIDFTLIVYHRDQILRQMCYVDCLRFLIAFQCVEAAAWRPTNLFGLHASIHHCVHHILLVALSDLLGIFKLGRRP